MKSWDFPVEVGRAALRTKPEVIRTPLEHSVPLSRLTGAEVWVKWEDEQVTGSFKFRGALNKVRLLTREEKKRGVVTASTGNHGLGVSRACEIEGVRLSLVLPVHAAEAKVRKLRSFGSEILFQGESCEKTEAYARQLAGQTGRVFISPYNDLDVIYGQGTAGKEIIEDLPGVDGLIVPLGGGGLISGTGGYLKSIKPEALLYGVEPRNSAFMAASLKAGRIVGIEEKETIADGVAGGIEPGSVTFSLCREFVDDIVLVGETRIKKAMSGLYEHHQKMIEGAGALALAGLLERPSSFLGKTIVLVASGGNISPEAFKTAVQSFPVS